MNISALPLNTPALRPPPGVTPNFQNPAGIQAEIHATLIFCLIISTIFVWSRFYVRYFINRSHGWDDCTFTIMFSQAITDIYQIHRSLRGHVAFLEARASPKSIADLKSQAGFVGYIVIALVASTHGSGLHQWDVRLRDFIIWAKVQSLKLTMNID